MDEELERHIETRQAVLARIRRILVEDLKVPLARDQIDLDAPLFGTGVGLDSIDAVELVVALETEFGLPAPEGGPEPWALRTVHALVELVVDQVPPGPRAEPDPAEPTPGGEQ